MRIRMRFLLVLALIAAHPLNGYVARAGDGFPPDIIGTGDIDEDGLNDLFMHFRPTGVGKPRTVRAHRGTDGVQLWARSELAGQFWPVPRGPGGHPGLLFAAQASSNDPPLPRRESVSLTAVDAQGRTSWTRTLRWVGDCCPLGSEFGTDPVGGVFIDADGDGTDDPLIVLDGFLYGDVPLIGPIADASALTAVVLDGETGEILTSTVVVDEGAGFGGASDAGDLDGDGRDDYVLVFGLIRSRVVAVDADTGLLLWDRSGDEFGRYVPGVGDMTGDGIDEVVLDLTGWQIVGGPEELTRVTVLDGADGKTLWAASGHDGNAYPLGDLDGDGRREVGYQTLGREGARSQVRYRAADGTGDPLYSVAYALDADGEARLEMSVEGDIDGDGASDPGHRLTISGPGGTLQDARIVSGANGLTLRPDLFVSFQLRASVDGMGDDFGFRTGSFGGDGSARVEDGLTGTVIWSRVFPAEFVSIFSPKALDLVGDARSEILVTLERSGAWRILAVDPRADETLWSLG